MLSRHDLSQQVKTLLEKSWTNGTKKQYAPYINKWLSYCLKHHLDPVNSPVTKGADFLADLFYSTKLEYSAMNTARSALSAILEPVDGLTFGKQPLIKRLLRGIFKERPTLPRYTVTYDVDIVFQFLASWDNPADLTLELLTKRLTTLMCILSGQRSQTLSVLSINSLHQESHRCIFIINSLLKQSRPNFHQQPLEFLQYPDDCRLCVVHHLAEYLKRTVSLRGGEKKLFISYVSPHKAVTSATISRWVCCVLKSAGINMKMFSAHSTRSAATSKSLSTGLSLTDIGKAAGWSGNSIFAKFYHKPLTANFGEHLLNNKQ